MNQSILASNKSSYVSIHEAQPYPTGQNRITKPACKWYILGLTISIFAVTLIWWIFKASPSQTAPNLEEWGYQTFESSTNKSRSFFYRLVKQSPPPVASRCLLLWINGGLGTSSQLGYFAGVGPRVLNPDTGEFDANPHSWNSFCDVLFVDQPMGTGMSNRRSAKDSSKPDLSDLPASYDEMADDLILFFRSFLVNRQYASIRLTGESLAGKVILRVGSKYLDQVNVSAPELVSVLLISPWIDAPGHYNLSLEYAVDSGMMSRTNASLLESAKNKCLLGISKPNYTVEDTQRCFAFYDQILLGSTSELDRLSVPEKYNIKYPGSENPYAKLRRAVQKQLQTENSDFKLNNGDIARYYAIENHQNDSEWYSRLLFGQTYGEATDQLSSRVKLRVLFGDKDFISHHKAGISAIGKVLNATSERLLQSGTVWTSANKNVQVILVKDAGHFACFDSRTACFDTLKDLITA